MLSYKTFFTWLEISLYQGQFVSIHSSTVGQEAHPLRCFVRCRVSDYDHVLDLVQERVIVSISFTALVLNELIMVVLEITIWYVAPSGSIGMVR